MKLVGDWKRVCALSLSFWMQVAVATPAIAQNPCPPRADLDARLTARYGETVRMSGMIRQEALIEVWRAESGTWTITITTPDGIACVLAVGDMLEVVPTGEAL